VQVVRRQPARLGERDELVALCERLPPLPARRASKTAASRCRRDSRIWTSAKPRLARIATITAAAMLTPVRLRATNFDR
jgi:hypothetical protein